MFDFKGLRQFNKLYWKYWKLCLMSHWFHTRIFLYFMLDLKWIYSQV